MKILTRDALTWSEFVEYDSPIYRAICKSDTGTFQNTGKWSNVNLKGFEIAPLMLQVTEALKTLEHPLKANSLRNVLQALCQGPYPKG